MKTIIFLFGGVFNLRTSVKEFWQNNAKVLGVDPEKADKITLDIWLKARIGKIDSDIFWTESAKLVKMSAEDFKDCFFNYTGWREDLYDFVKQELAGKYKLGMVSNQIESWLEPIIEEKGLRDLFDVIITSYELGIAKPDIRAYQEAVNKLAVDPKDCIYIDDFEHNLKPAQELGMETILFKDTASLKKELNKLLS